MDRNRLNEKRCQTSLVRFQCLNLSTTNKSCDSNPLWFVSAEWFVLVDIHYSKNRVNHCIILGFRTRLNWFRMQQPSLTICVGSTTVMVSSSMKYIILTSRIKSYCSAIGSKTLWRKKPLKVKMILSFCTKSGLNAAIGFDFTRPYVQLYSCLG